MKDICFKFFSGIGRIITNFIEEMGAIHLLFFYSITNLKYALKDRKIIASQMLTFGLNAVPIVALIGIFTGAVTAWQAAYQFEDIVPVQYIAPASVKAIFIELGPVLTALIIAGRNGASIAAEIGTMKTTEQIDALESLALDPVRFLAAPRIISGFTMLPLLVIFTDVIAVLGAFIVSNLFLNIDYRTFFNEAQKFFRLLDFLGGIIKSFVFGGTTAIIGCYIGFNTTGGAEGVGKATIRAFVLSSILILLIDYLLATILF